MKKTAAFFLIFIFAAQPLFAAQKYKGYVRKNVSAPDTPLERLVAWVKDPFGEEPKPHPYIKPLD